MASDAGDLGAEGTTARPKSDRTIAALLADLADQASSLIRHELALFKAELLEKLGLIGQGVGAIATGALIVFSGWLALVAAALLGLAICVLSVLVPMFVCLV